MSLLRDAINAQKGCPFCNFDTCRLNACIFYSITRRSGAVCSILATQANSALTAATSNYLLHKVESIQNTSLGQKDFEELKTQVRKLEEMLLLLEETKEIPNLPQSFQSTIESVREKIVESQKLIFAALGASF